MAEAERTVTSVYILMHIRPYPWGGTDEKWIGVYSSAERARKRLPSLRLQPGFRDFPDDFHVVRFEVDQDNPREEFASLSEADRRANLVAETGDRTVPQADQPQATIYQVWHEYEVRNGEDIVDVVKFVGFYSSEDKARDAVARFRDHPAFRDHADDFHIEDNTPDKFEGWLEGFHIGG